MIEEELTEEDYQKMVDVARLTTFGFDRFPNTIYGLPKEKVDEDD